MTKEEKIFEWLMVNNVLFETLDKYTNYKLIKKTLSEKQEEEIKNVFKHNEGLERTVYPIFSGEVCYLENSSFISKDNIEQSRKEIKDWMLKHIFYVTKEGITLTDECKSKLHYNLVNGLEYDNSRVYIPEFPYSSFSYYNKNKDKPRNCNIRLLKDCSIYSDILFKPCTYSMPYDLYGVYSNYGLFVVSDKETTKDKLLKKKRLNSNSLLDENNELRYKIKECQDLYIDMEHVYYNTFINFKTLKNFPDIVHGNIVFMYWDNILSLMGFPMMCENEVIFRNCRIPFNVKLPEGVTINKNLVCIDCANDYNLLIGILKHNWNIKGTIYTSLYTGPLSGLREIATKEQWI